MRALVKLSLALPAALLVAACGREADDAALAEDLRNDLEMAQAAGVELAVRPYDANKVVSGIEGAPKGNTREGARESRPVAKPKAPRREYVANPRPAPEVAEAPVAEVEEEPAPAEEQVAVVEAEAPAPEVAEAPAPAEEPEVIEGPGTRADPNAGRGGWGDIIGVVVRGGYGGIDNCDPRVHGPGGPIISIGNRYPGGRVYGGWGGDYVVNRPVSRPPVTGERTRLGGGIRSRGSLSMPAGPGAVARTPSGGMGRTRF